jgi:heme-degrading monooxygenase HmoA
MKMAVFFDVLPKSGFVDAYFAMALGLRSIAEKNTGFISVERFKNLQRPDWYLSFSNWGDEESLASWRCQPDHSSAQVCGRNLILKDYRLRVASEIPNPSIPTDLGRTELLMAYVGNFEAIKNALSKNTMPNSVPRYFQGVINPERGIALTEYSPNQPIQLERYGESDFFDLRCFSVVRDYGMFDRAQAPQQFI